MEIGRNREEKEYKPKVYIGGQAPRSEEDHEKSDSSLTGCVSLTMRCVVGSRLEFCSFFLDNHSQSSKGSCNFEVARKWQSWVLYPTTYLSHHSWDLIPSPKADPASAIYTLGYKKGRRI